MKKSTIIAVGSTNPVKVAAVTLAAKKIGVISVKKFEVASGVSHQPSSDEETKRGAENRARAALKQCSKADLGIGLEGGYATIDDALWNTVWCAVVDRKGQCFFANGERFKLPERIARELRKGKELGPVMDKITGRADIKKNEGMIGVVTKRYLDRVDIYANLASIAIGLWVGREWEKEY